MRKQKGFSLIELLIVVAIILIIAAIAVPNLMRSRMSANEASAVGSVRTIISAENLYFNANNTYADLPTLATDAAGNLIDNQLANTSATAPKSGYIFAAQAGSSGSFLSTFVVGAAAQSSSTGTREFCSDQRAVIRIASTTQTGTLATTCATTLTALGGTPPAN